MRTLLRPDAPIDLRSTFRPARRGPMDPTLRIGEAAVARAARTSEGAATLVIRRLGPEFELEAWGPGAGRAIEAAPALLGMRDEPERLRTNDPVVRALIRRSPGLRIGSTGAVFDAVLPSVLEQKVVGEDAHRAYAGLVRSEGEPAPGPAGLFLPPAAEAVARIPYWTFHRHNVERRRAATIIRAAVAAPGLESAGGAGPDALKRRLCAIPGIGPWTAAEVSSVALGDPDAVPVGDYHLPNAVAWALAGERRADDRRMLELLRPFDGQRGRVIRLILAAGMAPPRRAPRMPLRSIAGQ